MNTTRPRQQHFVAPFVAGLLALFCGCALVPRSEYALPSAELERVQPGLSVAEVDGVLGAATFVELLDAHTERHVYVFDSLDSTDQAAQTETPTTFAMISVVCRDSFVIEKGVEHVERRKPYYAKGKPNSSRKYSLSKAQLGWRTKFVAHTDAAPREASVTGMWRIAAPHSSQGHPMISPEVEPNWLIVCDGDRLYLEPAARSVWMKPSWFSGSRSTDEGQPRTWKLEGESGPFDRWDVQLTFDPKLQSLEARWVEPYRSQGNGLLLDIGAKLVKDHTSSAIVTAGQRIDSSRPSKSAQPAATPRASAAN